MSPTDQDTQSSPLTQNKHQPAAPPPPYREFATEQGSASPAPTPSPALSNAHIPPSAPCVQPQQMPSQIPTGVPMAMPHHVATGYGPTPLATNQPLLPYVYYESRGSADARARLRFIHALAWAIGLWVIFGSVIGVELWCNERWELSDWGGVWEARSWLKLGGDGLLEFA